MCPKEISQLTSDQTIERNEESLVLVPLAIEREREKKKIARKRYINK